MASLEEKISAYVKLQEKHCFAKHASELAKQEASQLFGQLTELRGKLVHGFSLTQGGSLTGQWPFRAGRFSGLIRRYSGGEEIIFTTDNHDNLILPE